MVDGKTTEQNNNIVLSIVDLIRYNLLSKAWQMNIEVFRISIWGFC